MFTDMAIADVKLIEPQRHQDARGYLSETYSLRSFREGGIPPVFVQDNQSYSKRAGTVRGLHFQWPPFMQAKLVRVIRGAVFDVAVDLRAGSPTFARWVGAELSAANGVQMYVPEGFAHGFMTLTDETEVLYKLSAYFAPGQQGGVRWDDPAIAIAWPQIGPAVTLSEKDATLTDLAAVGAGLPSSNEAGWSGRGP